MKADLDPQQEFCGTTVANRAWKRGRLVVTLGPLAVVIVFLAIVLVGGRPRTVTLTPAALAGEGEAFSYDRYAAVLSGFVDASGMVYYEGLKKRQRDLSAFAAQLAGLVLSQLVREGAPFIRCSCGGATFDMKTMVPQHVGPEARGFQADLANWYGLPSFGMGGLSGSKILDGQAAIEAALTLLLASLSGEGMIHDVGYMDNGLTASLQQLVICDELIDWVRYYLRGLEINEDTLALDVIHEVGPDGQFMEMQHTALHCRDDWYPELFDRNGYDRWAEEGGLTLQDRAGKKVEEILEGYTPRPIPEKVKQAWEDIIDR